MSEGFGHLRSLKDLNLQGCLSLKLLPDSESCCLESFYFYFLMSEGFGQLASLKELDLRCPAGRNLPAELKDNLVAQGCSLQL